MRTGPEHRDKEEWSERMKMEQGDEAKLKG